MLRSHGEKRLQAEHDAIMRRVKARLFFSYLVQMHLRLVTGSFITWCRYLHLTNVIRGNTAAINAATAAAIAMAAAVTAQNAATVAANLAKDDELGKMILALKKSGKTKKEPSEVSRLGANKALFRMLLRKSNAILDSEFRRTGAVTRVGGRYKISQKGKEEKDKHELKKAKQERKDWEQEQKQTTKDKAKAKGGKKEVVGPPIARKWILEYFKQQHGKELSFQYEGGKKDTVTKKKVDEFLLALMQATVGSLVTINGI